MRPNPYLNPSQISNNQYNQMRKTPMPLKQRDREQAANINANANRYNNNINNNATNRMGRVDGSLNNSNNGNINSSNNPSSNHQDSFVKFNRVQTIRSRIDPQMQIQPIALTKPNLNQNLNLNLNTSINKSTPSYPNAPAIKITNPSNISQANQLQFGHKFNHAYNNNNNNLKLNLNNNNNLNLNNNHNNKEPLISPSGSATNIRITTLTTLEQPTANFDLQEYRGFQGFVPFGLPKGSYIVSEDVLFNQFMQ